ncbi:MAG TPA: hypothetical protein VK509_17500, partial [Polyangiales bacterium]|nr:hypothetical protein [Polyangiales bacterium]
MREIEVARRRVATRRCNARSVLCSTVVANLLLVALLGCGDATCPAGSRSVDGKCVPAKACDGGGECMQESGVSGDGGTAIPDGGAKPPGRRNDAGGSAGTSGAGGAPADDAGQDTGQPDDAAAKSDADSDGGADAEPPDTDPEPVGPCVGYACGAHGTCEVVADAPQCACDSDFTGERCDRCVPGLGFAGDSCVPACRA